MVPPHSEPDFVSWGHHARALAVVAAWNEAGLFAALRDGPRFLNELGADRRALEVTVPMLRHLGFLVGEGDRIGLSTTGRRLLNEGSLPPGRELDSLRDLSRMHEVLREGGPVRDDEGRRKSTRTGVTSDPEATRRFLDYLYRISEPDAESCFQWLAAHLPEKGGAVLDLGGGHGRYARIFADHGHSATVFDLPHVVEYARERHGEALSYLAGDYHETRDFGGEYDLVLLSDIVHGEPFEVNQALLRRCADHLRPGGWLALKDMFLDARCRDPEHAVFFGLKMLFYTDAGRSPTLDEAAAWLAGAGLKNLTVTGCEGFEIVRARKPG